MSETNRPYRLDVPITITFSSTEWTERLARQRIRRIAQKAARAAYRAVLQEYENERRKRGKTQSD